MPAALYKSAPSTGAATDVIGTSVLEGEFLSPLMLLKSAAVENNIAEMSRFCRDVGVSLAPHAKTAMSPELVDLQLGHDPWAISAATMSQVRTLRSFGVESIVLANELVDPAAIAWLVDDLAGHPDRRFCCYVDSIDGVDLIEACVASTNADVVVDVLLEVSLSGGRTGCRSLATCRKVAEQVSSSAHLRLVGVAGYEGALGSDRTEETLGRIADFCIRLRDVADELDAAHLFAAEEVILSAGGGAFLDLVASALVGWQARAARARVVIRPGSYVSHDDGFYAEIAAFAQPESQYRLRSALEIWGRVLSRPEPRLAFLDFGRRDVSFDQGLPLPQTVRDIHGRAPRPAAGFTLTALNDQHAYLSVPADDLLAVGEWVGCGISHPCTAFDKWRFIPLVDDSYTCVGTVTTRF